MDDDARATTVGKSPINLLQELCIKYSVAPTYDLISSEGPTHMPTFCWQVTAGNIKATGKGTSKKIAKHEAAQKAVSMIKSGTPIVAGGSPLRASVDSSDVVAAGPQTPLKIADSSIVSSPVITTSPSQDDGYGVNPIGELQEYAQKHSLTPPEYDYPPETGPAHARTFACSVTFDGKQEKGYGKTKKDAKREAAGRMVQLVKCGRHGSGSAARSFRSVDDASFNSDDEGSTVIMLNDDEEPLHYDSIKHKSVPTLTPDGSQATSEFFENLRNDPGTCLLGLQQHSLIESSKVNYVQKLDEISKEKKFSVVYVHIDEPSKAGKRQCLLQLSTQPVAICFGTGETCEEAEQEAAYNSLQYLKIMTSKD